MSTDEKGNEITSPEVEISSCTWCGDAMPVRARGRRPKFCQPQCRSRHWRATQRVTAAYAELLAAEEALRAGGRAA